MGIISESAKEARTKEIYEYLKARLPKCEHRPPFLKKFKRYWGVK